MASKYKINPVKATCMKYDGKDHGIQALNDTCFKICGDFSGSNSNYNMDPECSNSCQEFIEKKKREIFGVGSCDHQVPYRPVLWGEIPPYVPALLAKGLSPEGARDECLKLCETVTNRVDDCKERCIVNYNAIEGTTPIESAPKKVRFTEPPSTDLGFKFFVQENYKESNKKMYYLISAISLIVIVIIVTLVLRKK